MALLRDLPDNALRTLAKRVGDKAPEEDNLALLIRLRASAGDTIGVLVRGKDLPPEAARACPSLDFLFYQGDERLLEAPAVAVVGSRTLSPRLRDDGITIGRALARAGCVVTSGLALGADRAAHEGAMQERPRAVTGVLPEGITVRSAGAGQEFANEVARSGVLVSQFAPAAPAKREHFLARNEVISAFSRASVIVAAAARSGTRNEIRHALRQGRRVLLWERGTAGQPWAQDLVRREEASFVSNIEEMLELLHE